MPGIWALSARHLKADYLRLESGRSFDFQKDNLLNGFTPAPVKPNIGIDLLQKVDIRVGTIKDVRDVLGSDKLVRLNVDFGDHTRTIFVGMKQERTDPTEIKGQQALFVVNLEPRKMMGELSEGMLLDIGYEDGLTRVLAVPEKDIPAGVRAG